MPVPELSGLQTLVTRPALQAESLADALRNAGAIPVLFPTLEITPVSNQKQLIDHLGASAPFDWLIFTSTNAVRYGLPLLIQSKFDINQTQVAAVGEATAASLHDADVVVTAAPKATFNSEALAELPEFQNATGLRVLIVRGVGGREWLRDTLVVRGAEVEYLECYRRICPKSDPQPIVQRCRSGALHVVTSTSNEGLVNLLSMLGEDQCITQLPLLVIGGRQAAYAESLHWRGPILVANDPRTATIVSALRPVCA